MCSPPPEPPSASSCERVAGQSRAWNSHLPPPAESPCSCHFSPWRCGLRGFPEGALPVPGSLQQVLCPLRSPQRSADPGQGGSGSGFLPKPLGLVREAEEEVPGLGKGEAAVISQRRGGECLPGSLSLATEALSFQQHPLSTVIQQ